MSDRVPLAWRFARRELRSGVRGFRIFLACLALGVAALAAAGSTEASFRHALDRQARSVFGGDVSAGVEERRFTPAERAVLVATGRVTEVLHVRAMAENASGDRRLAEVRGVDAAYPLAGTVSLAGAPDLGDALRTVDGVPGAVVDPHLLERLRLRVGDTFRIGVARFAVRAVLRGEPDALGRGFALGGAILVSRPVLERSGLIAPGDLFGDTVRIALPPGGTLGAALDRLRPVAADGVRLRDRRDAAGGLRVVIADVTFFLGFIGLASLLAGGVGVATAVTAHLDGRRASIAVLKTLGAPGATVRNIYLLQIGALAAFGVLIGLALGALAPPALGALVGRALPIPIRFALYPVPLLVAGLFGLLAAATFGLGPLAAARATPPLAILRRDADGGGDADRSSGAARRRFPGRIGPGRVGPERVAQALAACGLAALAIGTAPTPVVACAMVAAVGIAFALLRVVGAGAVRLARVARPLAPGGNVRLGLANLAGPGSAARVATPAIGLGVALLVALLTVENSIVSAVRDAAPRAAPNLLITGINEADGPALDRIVAVATGAKLSPDRYRRDPFATGRITALRGVPVDPARIRASERWAFDRDMGLTTLAAPPPDADVTAGRWWPADYAGPPEIIVADRIARAAGLRVGDTLVVSVLGRDLDARIAALRRVEFGRFGASVPLILDPHALAGAHLREVAIARTRPSADGAIIRALGRVLPDVTIIDIREQLASIAVIFRQLTAATAGATGVTALAGLLVLAGAVAATSRARAREAAVLTSLGAGRAQILAAYLVEYGTVGLIAASSGLVVGLACAWPVVALVLRTPWPAEGGEVSLLLACCVAACAVAGLLGALTALRRPPASVLRDD